MRIRTRLATPRGQEPETTGRRVGGRRELYSRGFAMPAEPGFPTRWAWFSAGLLAALLVAALTYLLSQVAGVQEQDLYLVGNPREFELADL